MPIQLIATDIDGTLLDSKSQVSAANSQAIAEAAARGIEIVLVTGRRFDFALPIAQSLPCDLHMIVNNGALAKSRRRHDASALPAAEGDGAARARRYAGISRECGCGV